MFSIVINTDQTNSDFSSLTAYREVLKNIVLKCYSLHFTQVTLLPSFGCDFLKLNPVMSVSYRYSSDSKNIKFIYKKNLWALIHVLEFFLIF